MSQQLPHALITGGSSGIGLAIAQALNAHEFRVSVCARQAPKEGFTSQFTHPSLVHFVPMDVSDDSSVMLAHESAKAHFGAVGVLVNNAGQAKSASFEKSTLQNFQAMMDVNLYGSVRCIHAMLSDLKAQPYARIINIASTAALVGYAYTSAYCASKHAVLGLTRSLALELAKTNITVNAVCPGYTDTPLVQEALTNISQKTGKTKEQALAEISKFNPMARLVSAQEVAHTVLWLASEHSSGVNAQAIAVDGGEVMTG